MTLTEKQMIDIINNKKIDQCTREERNQVCLFAFGEAFTVEKDGRNWRTLAY